jgi:hypothetical protein
MSHDDQLAWEARAGKPAAAAAVMAGVTGFAGYVLSQLIRAGSDDGSDGFLREIDERNTDFIASAALQAVSFLLLLVPLLYLFRATRYRRPQFSQTAAILAALGAVTLAVAVIVQQLRLVDIASDFFPFEVADNAGELSGDEYAEAVDPDKAAEERIQDEIGPALPGIVAGGTLALAFSVVMITLNAMRVGLLSRFMGVLGIGMGVMFVIPFGIQPILQLYWLAALALIFINRWPGGRGPAWQTGEAIPWPGAAEQREEIERRRAEREGVAEAPAESVEQETPRPSSRKRKKKGKR